MSEVPPVTRDEIIAVFHDDPRWVWSAQQIAERIWRRRGGEGEWDGPPRRRNDVPMVVARHVRPLLQGLREGGTLACAVGGRATQLGIAYDGPQHNVAYYALASAAQHRQQAEEAQRQDRAVAKEYARYLRAAHADRLEAVEVPKNGRIVLTLTVEQARALFDALPPSTDSVTTEPVDDFWSVRRGTPGPAPG